MKNRIYKLFAVVLAVMMIVVSVPTPASAASACTHENATFHHYSYEYEYVSASYHRVYTLAWDLCTDCNHYVGEEVSSKLEAHTYGSAVWTGNHYHSGKFHIYETVSTCASCRHQKYAEVSYVCNGDGVNCPIIMG